MPLAKMVVNIVFPDAKVAPSEETVHLILGFNTRQSSPLLIIMRVPIFDRRKMMAKAKAKAQWQNKAWVWTILDFGEIMDWTNL